MSQLGSLGFTDADLTPRLKFVNILPSVVFLMTVGALWLGGAPAQPPAFTVLKENVEDINWPGALVLTASALVIGLLLQPLELASIRFLEGYWKASGPLQQLGERGRWIQQRRKDRLVWLEEELSQSAYEELVEHVPRELASFPDGQQVLPTALGNRLRAAEERAGKAYSLDATLTWPRLYFVLPPDVLRFVSQSRNELDTAVRLCLSFALTSLVSAALLLRHPVWLALPLGFALLSGLAYRAAVHAAQAYGVTFTSVIDVYRLRLLKEMSVKMPADSDDEIAINDKLRLLWEREGPLEEPVPYAAGEPSPPAA
ncbi:hypothetical protein OG496_55165 [Streptomyces sp. NBC_00988]|uniref:hypothetical protein n=1 Tax=Streptomyces sp. NBC_00988 TaxID=2903704 RepID=UPI00386DA456|nr:hypothetical protein OG496_00120 [Streptomyces sp. NBC_00988]WSX17734.1 hypothetical protein OG496_55165 [Streptomyces sp. NBC_00988]